MVYVHSPVSKASLCGRASAAAVKLLRIAKGTVCFARSRWCDMIIGVQNKRKQASYLENELKTLPENHD